MPTTARRIEPRTGGAGPILGAGETHVGHVRPENQDVIVVEPDLGLYAVLDGMGGHNAGGVAAQLASEVITDFVRENVSAAKSSPGKVLDDALFTASAVVYVAGEKVEQCRGMGTTAVACLVVDSTRVVIAHLGDSRAYLLRAGELAQLTRDHTAAQELLDQGKIRSRSMRQRPEAHILTRSVGGGGRPDVQELGVRPGDRLLLCSDGLHGYTPLRSIRRVLAGGGAPDVIAHELVELALRGDAPDNITAVVIALGGGEVEEKRRSGARR